MSSIPNLRLHPEIILDKIKFENTNDVIEYEFAKYIYSARSLREKQNRKVFRINKNLWSESLFIELLNSLDENEDLAFQSRIYINGRTYFLPIIDFNTRNFNEIWESIQIIVPSNLLNGTYFFSTGRSFHAYFLQLLTKVNWYKFLGTILLMNDSKTIVDQRWVGHSLRTGYSALRWSMTSERYKIVPNFYGRVKNNYFVRNLE